MKNQVMETSTGGGINLKAGTAGGTLFVLLAQLRWEEVTKTALLAVIGAVVSFVVSAGIRWLGKKMLDDR